MGKAYVGAAVVVVHHPDAPVPGFVCEIAEDDTVTVRTITGQVAAGVELFDSVEAVDQLRRTDEQGGSKDDRNRAPGVFAAWPSVPGAVVAEASKAKAKTEA